MPSANDNPLVAILLRVAKEAPRPWFYRQGLEKTPENEQLVAQYVEILEFLHKEGLVSRYDSASPETGPGVVLTEKGRGVVMDPEARQKLADGVPLDPDDVGSVVRGSVRAGLTPWLTRGLVLANLVVFAFGAYLAYRNGFLQAYATGFPGDGLTQQRHLRLLNGLGSMNGRALLDGEWWRMGAGSFLHMGGLHLLMNVWSLWSIGAFVERILGRWKMLLIFAMGAWGCACLAMAMTPGQAISGSDLMRSAMGASGAVCGLLGGLAVWTLLVSHHLPAEMASSLRTQMVINGIIMVVISLMPGVSAWGHAGGAMGGALAALALHHASYGPRLVRPLAYASLIGVAYLGFWYLQSKRETSEDWARLEGPHFRRHVSKQVDKAEEEAARLYRPLGLQFKMHKSRRDAKEVEVAIAGLSGPLAELERLRLRLADPVPYRARDVRDVSRAGESYLEALTAFYRDTIRCLEAGEKWTREDDKARDVLADKMTDAFEAWVKAEKELPGIRTEARK